MVAKLAFFSTSASSPFFAFIILILTNIRITIGFYYHLRLRDAQKSAYTKCCSGGVPDPQVYSVAESSQGASTYHCQGWTYSLERVQRTTNSIHHA